ncbi:hypothetical protein V6x_37580 [Gimesia chilikensis]|uniref:Uncharacterized protein n=1 Tax=Gimesia chilikensis TaxID=2605989 RepID=A0A517WFN5_9PLAN|nr:hypothetical protein V6x_37580 [Gimesia chilikensis]
MMEYRFRRGFLFGEETIVMAEHSLQRLNRHGKVTREIPYKKISRVNSYSGLSAYDEEKKSFPVKMVRIIPHWGLSINFQSSYYLRMGSRQMQMAKNQLEAYEAFLEELKNRIRTNNPDAVLQTGNRILSVLSYLFALFCLVLFLLGLAAPVYALFVPTRSLRDIWPVLIALLFITAMFGRTAFHMGQDYAPERRKL